MGWLGWTEQQTLNTDMASIVLAYEGRQDMIHRTLECVFGTPKEEQPAKPLEQAAAPIHKPVSATQIQTVFRLLAGPK